MRPTSLTATVAAAALVGTALLATTTGATSAAPTRSSAYGVAVQAGGQEAVPPSPTVESTDGSTQTTGGSIPPEASPLVAGGVLELSAGDDEASVVVTDLALGQVGALPPEVGDQLAALQAGCNQLEEELPELPDGELPELPDELDGLGLDPDQLAAFCDSLGGDLAALANIGTLQVACAGDSGTVSVLDASAVGVGTPEDLRDVAPNTELIPENPLISVTVNRQHAAPKGGFTVDGLVVSLGEGQAEAVVASATCGQRIVTRGEQDRPEPRRAPAPQPQQENVPVTG